MLYTVQVAYIVCIHISMAGFLYFKIVSHKLKEPAKITMFQNV